MKNPIKIYHSFLLLISLLFAQLSQGSNNYVKISSPKEAIANPLNVNGTNSSVKVDYRDGFGQTYLSKEELSSGADIISMSTYGLDGAVREKWLPVVMPHANAAPTMIEVQQSATQFYGDSNPYTRIVRYSDTDAATKGLTVMNNMVLSLDMGPGADWQNKNKGTKVEKFDSYTQNIEVKQYGVEGNNLVLYENRFDLYQCNVQKFTDADNCTVYRFTDAYGKLLLHRKISETENFDTYYVYDEMGHLRFILSPEASDQLSTSGTYSLGSKSSWKTDVLAKYAYIYQYDARGHCTAKKLPGKDWVKMMYDNADRLIFTQNGNQRASNQWSFFKYDIYNRPIQTGTTSFALSEADMQLKYYSDNLAVDTYIAGTGYKQSCEFCTNTVVLTQDFYDSYDFINLPAYAAIKPNLSYVVNNSFSLQYSRIVDGIDIALRGQKTGSSVAMMDNSATIVTANYYDEQGHIVQKRANNHLGGYDYDYFLYNFSGQVTNKSHVHKTPYITAEIIENYRMLYNTNGQLTSVRHKLNTQSEVVMDSLLYDAVGRVTNKIIHNGIQNIAYTYNIRNQIKTLSSAKFSETLYYNDTPFGEPYYNGNISQIKFGSEADKQYYFTYDKLNRLTKAVSDKDLENSMFTEQVDEYDKNGNIKKLKRYGYAYDYSHNISYGLIDDLTLSYTGNQLTNVSDAANQTNVITTNDFVDKVDGTYPEEYYYDSNGNCTADLNKKIGWIQYNLLNLPQKVQFRNGTRNEYIYDGQGVKRRSAYSYSTSSVLIPLGDTSQGSSTSTTYQLDYCGNYVYEKSGTLAMRLKRIVTPEGYIETYAGLLSYIGYWKYSYSLKDHQGNTRVLLSSDYLRNPTSKTYVASAQIDYYPFGLERSNTGQSSSGPLNSGTIPYLYSNKEVERVNGLNEYDFSARWMDPAVPAFQTSDPLAEQTPWDSPYGYCSGDPVNNIDPTGMASLQTVECKAKDPNRERAAARSRREALWNQMACMNGSSYAEHDDPYATDYPTQGNSNKEEETLTNVTKGLSFNNSKKVIDYGGGTISSFEKLVSSKGFWLGANGKYNLNRWGGNQYTASRAGAFEAAKLYKSAGTALVYASIGIGLMETREGYFKDGGKMGYNAWHAAASNGGSIIAGWAGAQVGAEAGAAVGAFFGGVGAIPGAVLGGAVGVFVGGIYAGNVGGEFGEEVVDKIYNK